MVLCCLATAAGDTGQGAWLYISQKVPCLITIEVTAYLHLCTGIYDCVLKVMGILATGHQLPG
jgi:hypothetical protein